MLSADQFGKFDAGAAGPRSYFAVSGDEIAGRLVETLGRQLDQRLARGRRGLPDLHAAALDAARAGGASLIGGEHGVALDIFYLVDADTEFLGGDLRDRDAQALAEIDLAAVERDGAVAVHREESVDLLVVEDAGCDCRTLRGSRAQAGERKSDGKRATFEQCAAGEAVLDRCVHGKPLCPAAAITARTTRTWMPQRQRLPSSAARTSSSLGFGVLASSAAADMMIPLVQ